MIETSFAVQKNATTHSGVFCCLDVWAYHVHIQEEDSFKGILVARGELNGQLDILNVYLISTESDFEYVCH